MMGGKGHWRHTLTLGGGEFLLGREFGYKERGWGTRERVIYDTLPKQKQNEVLMIRWKGKKEVDMRGGPINSACG